MTQKTRLLFKNDQAAQLADNTIGSITAAKLRAEMTNIADSASFPEDFTGNSLLMTAAERTKISTFVAYEHPNHSGDVVSTGDAATVISAGVVTNAKLALVATGTIKGRLTAATGAPEDLTLAQITNNLTTFTATTKGVVPAPGAAANNLLADNGSFVNSWALPVTTNIIPSVDGTRNIGNTTNRFATINMFDINLNGVLFSSINLSNPGGNRLAGWNNITGNIQYFNLGEGLSFANNTINADLALEIKLNTVTTNYTLILTDRHKKILGSSASAIIINIPTDAVVAFPIGTIMAVSSINTGSVRIQAPAGVTLNGLNAGGGNIVNQFSGISLVKYGTNAWLIEGTVGTVS